MFHYSYKNKLKNPKKKSKKNPKNGDNVEHPHPPTPKFYPFRWHILMYLYS